jgi:hypothetical protein
MTNERALEAVSEILEEYISPTKVYEEKMASRIVQAVLQHAPSRAVEVPTVDDVTNLLYEYLSDSDLPDEFVRDALLLPWAEKHAPALQAKLVALAQRPAPSAQAWTRERASDLCAAYEALTDARGPKQELRETMYIAGARLFGSTAPSAPSAQAWTRELARSMAEDFDRRNESHDEPDNDTWAEDMFCAGIKAFGMRCPTTAPVTSAQGGALPALEDIARDLENIHGIRGKAQAMNVAGYLRERIAGRAGTKPTTPAGVALQGRTHQLEEQREALETALAAAERDLAAERAAHEAANDELIAMLGRAERAEKRAAELERERDEAQNGYDDHANLCRTLTTERDSLRAELAKVREESVGKRLLEVTVRERNEARAELAACRAKLEGLREACALSEAEASYLSTYVSCDHDSPVAVIKRIQSALQATQAEKPAIAAELAACKAKLEEMRREARAFECAAQLTDEECARLEDDDGNASDVLAALQERLTFAQARLRVSSHAIHPEPASAEKPDLPPRVTQRDVDVLATMADDSVNMTAQLEDIRKRFGMMSDVDAVTVRVDELELSAQQAFERIGRLEAASAEKPSLEERVGRHEQALRHILDALGKLTTEHGDSVTTVYGDTSLADAREALDGAGNGGG